MRRPATGGPATRGAATRARRIRRNPDERVSECARERVLERLLEAGPPIKRWMAFEVKALHTATVSSLATLFGTLSESDRESLEKGEGALIFETFGFSKWLRHAHEAPAYFYAENDRLLAELPHVYKFFEWAGSVDEKWTSLLLKLKEVLDAGAAFFAPYLATYLFCERGAHYGVRASRNVTCRLDSLSSIVRVWCDDCIAEHSHTCDGCGAIFSNEYSGLHCRVEPVNYPDYDLDDEPDYDPDPDYDEDDVPSLVTPYHRTQRRTSFTPHDSDWVRAQPEPLYFGVELEVFIPPPKPGRTRKKSDREPYAEQVLDSIGPRTGPFLYDIQHDSSLGTEGKDGFEIITQPCGLDTHRRYWSEADLTSLLNDHYRDPDHFTAGMHIHFSKSALERDRDGCYPVLGRMAKFLCAPAHAAFVTKVARREFNPYAQKLLNGGIRRGDPNYSFHRHALNTTGDHTAEFRLPKSTCSVTTIMATLEFVFLLLRFCEETSSPRSLTVARFKKFVAEDRWQNDSRFLRPYLVDQNLATAREMKLEPARGHGSEPVRSNPSRRARFDDDTPGYYARRALIEYRHTGE